MPIKRRKTGEQLKGAPGQRQVFLDVGANVGQTLLYFHNGETPTSDSIDFDGWLAVSFEPNPKLHDKIEVVQQQLGVVYTRAKFMLAKAGCWWEDTELTFYEGVNDHEAGTFAEWRRKRAPPSKRWPNGSGDVVASEGVKLPVIDFPAWMKRYLKPDDFIVLKMDIEGAEYKLVEVMRKQGVMDWVDVFYCEWGNQSIVPPVPRSRTNELIRELEAKHNLSVRAWL